MEAPSAVPSRTAPGFPSVAGTGRCLSGWRGFLRLVPLLLLAVAARAETIRVGVEGSSAPLTAIGSDGKPYGFAIDIVNAIAKDQGLDVVYVSKPWNEILSDLRSGQIDMVANISYASERATYMDFSVATLQLSSGVFYNIHAAKPLTQDDLQDLRVATGHQSLSEVYLLKHGQPPSNLRYYPSLPEALEAVNRGDADASIGTGPVGLQIIKDRHLTNLAPAPFVLPDLIFESHMAVPAGRTFLLYRLNSGLADIRANGAYDKIYERWIGPLDPRTLRWRDVQALVLTSALAVLILLVAFFWQRRNAARLYNQAEALRRTRDELRESQNLLNRSAQLLQQTQSAARIGGWELETESGQLFWTEESYRLHGVQPNGYSPTFESLLQFYAPESRPILRAALGATFQTGAPCDLEVELLTPDGRRLQVHVTGRAEHGSSGNVVRAYGSFHDITSSKRAAEERDKLQQKMLETQKLESLGVLAGGIAHDFNNILTVILSNAHLARMMNTLSTEMDEYLKQIVDASRRAAELCQRMLAYAGKGKLVLERVDLSALVTDSRPLLEHLVSKKAALKFAVTTPLPGIDADAAQIHQVLLNLTVNASEALEGHEGQIEVTTGIVDLDQTAIQAIAPLSPVAPGRFVYLRVEDTGIGMSPETLAKIFDPFFTTKFTGRGLGLAAVHGIARGHNGLVSVKSELGKGTSFQLYLPAINEIAPAAPKAALTAPRARSSNGHRTILLAEDEDTVRTAAAAMLRHFGYGSVVTKDGKEALDAFRKEPDRFDAVLLDLTMPRLDGAEALKAIRQIKPGVKALVMSGFGEEETLARLRDAGPALFLHKPFTPDDLAERLSQVLP